MVKVEYEISLRNEEFTQIGPTYWDPAVSREVVLIDVSKFVNPKFYFEAVGRSEDLFFYGFARLFNVSDNVAVTNADVSLESLTNKRFRSVEFTAYISGAKHYKVQLCGSIDYETGLRYQAWLRTARVIVVDDIADWTKGEEQVEVGSVYTTTSATPVELAYPPIYLHEATKRDGVIAIFFEATFYSVTSGSSVEVSLWNKTDATQVVELSTTVDSPQCVRSSEITLTDGKEYYVKIRSSSGAVCRTGGAKIIIQQSNLVLNQTLENSSIKVDSQDDIRAGQRITITNQKITKVKFLLTKINNPTGTGYARIMRFSDGSIIATSSTELDVSTLSALKTWKEFAFADVLVNEEVRIFFEYTGGDANNYVEFWKQNTDVCAGALTTCSSPLWVWSTWATQDAAIVIEVLKITKIQLHKKTAIPKYGTQTAYTELDCEVYLDKANLPSNPIFYYQAVLKVTSGYTAYSEIYDINTPASVSGSEVSSTSTSWERKRSGSISLTDLKEHDSRVKVTSGGTYYISAAWIITDIAPAPPPPVGRAGLNIPEVLQIILEA